MIIPVGSIFAFAGDITATNPVWVELNNNGWEKCDGGLANRTEYSELFSIINTSWGKGDGSTTFNLPDLRGQFIRGYDITGATDPDSDTRHAKYDGGATGSNIGSYQLTATKLPNSPFEITPDGKHKHTITGIAFSKIKSNLSSTGNDVGRWGYSGETSEQDNHTHDLLNGGDNETRPPNVYVNFIIKAKEIPEKIININLTSGDNVIDTFNKTAAYSCKWLWVIKKDNNFKSGEYFCVWDSDTDTIEGSAGDTSPTIGTVPYTFSTDISGVNVVFNINLSSDDWEVILKRTLL